MLREQETHVSTQSYGTATHAAPELLMDGRLTRAADVYAFALLVWELASGQKLYPEMTAMQVGGAWGGWVGERVGGWGCRG